MFRVGSSASVLSRARALALVAASAVGAWDCLPDLAITTPSVSPFCGDGTIDPDAGEECDPGDAAASGCSAACKVDCVGTAAFVDSTSKHCYFSAGLQGASPTPESVCEGESAHLVRLVSDAELALVASNAPTNDLWVGMMHDAAAPPGEYAPIPSNAIEPGWSATCPGCYGGAAPIEGDAGNCVVEQAPAQPWLRSACAGAKFETICEREPSGSRATFCSEAVCFTVAATANAKRYVLVPQRLAASDAVTACQSYGGRLVVFGSREEREQVAYEVANQSVAAPTSDYWIGLTSANGTWGWDADAGAFPPQSVLGERQSVVDAGARAFALIAPGAVDSELARAELGGGVHDALCEITY